MNNGYSGKIPPRAFMDFERRLAGQTHAVVGLVLHIRDGQLARYEIDTHETFLPEAPAGGVYEPHAR